MWKTKRERYQSAKKKKQICQPKEKFLEVNRKKKPIASFNVQIFQGVMNGIGAVIDGMLKRGKGHIVNISSDAGKKVSL